MTFKVQWFCLNHGELITTVGIPLESRTELKIDLCKASFHQIYHKLHEFKTPDVFGWLYPKNNPLKVVNEIEKKAPKIGSFNKNTIQKYSKAWNEILSIGLDPELVFNINAKKLPKSILEFKFNQEQNEVDLRELIDLLIIENEPSFDFKDLKRELSIAKMRTQACINFRFLPREYENDFFNKLKCLRESNILEQRWIILLASRYYVISGINNLQMFLDLIKSSLQDYNFLIRNEVRDVLIAAWLFNPDIRFNLIKNLLKDSDINIRLSGIKALSNGWRELEGIIDNEYQSQDFSDLPYKLINISDKINFHDISLQFEHAIACSEHIINEYLPNKASFWKPFDVDALRKKFDPAKISNDSEKEMLTWYKQRIIYSLFDNIKKSFCIHFLI